MTATAAPATQAAPATETKEPAPVLDRMIWIASREAERIAVWQRTGKNGEDIPEEMWDPRQRVEYKLFKDLAQLAYLVKMTEPEFREIVKKKLGTRPSGRLRKGESDRKPLEEATDDGNERAATD